MAQTDAQKPRILATKTLAKTRLFHIQELALRFANGVETIYERLISPHAGAVLVVPMQDDDTVLLVREYAAGMDRYELGLPKGRIEHNEAPLVAANRECMEEVGYGARDLRLLDSVTLAPGYLGHITHLVLARDLYPEQRDGDEPEALEVVPWRLSELDTLLARNDFTEARSIAALFMTREYLSNG